MMDVADRRDPEVIEIELTDMANGGDAVGHLAQRAVFVHGGIAGEAVRAVVTEEARTFWRASVVDVLRPSPDRVAPLYPDLSETGGLQWQHIAYPAQLAWKAHIVRQLLQRIGRFAQPPVQMTIGTPPDVDYWRQRTVAQFAVADSGAIGFRRMGSHDVLDMPACPIVHPGLDAVYQQARRWLISQWGDEAGAYVERFTIRIAVNPPPQASAGKRGVTRRRLPALLSLEASPGGRMLDASTPEDLANDLMRAIPQLAGVVIVGLPGRRGRVAIGQDFVLDQVLTKTFRISAGSFFQVNASQTPHLVQKALAFANPRQTEEVLDGYSGVGLFSLFLADQARGITAIESQPSAVADARASAALNQATNLTFMEGLLERVIPQLRASRYRPQVVIVDPPRAGCHPRALQEIRAMGPRSLVYISCDPATLARDLHLFCTDGYRLVMVQPVDMFPNTPHIETVSLIERW